MAVDKFGNPISDQYSNIPENYMEGFRSSQFNKPVVGGMMVTDVTLPDGKKVQFGDTGSAAQFRNYLDSINVKPQDPPTLSGIKANPGTNPDGSPINVTFPVAPQPTLTDPSNFAQAQVGASVRQPSLPTGTAVTPGLALQQSTSATEQVTPGLTGTQAAAVPTATPAPTITSQAIPQSSTIAQQATADAPMYTAVTGATTPQMTAAQGTVSAPMVAQQQDLTALPPEATVQGQLANISSAINTAVDEGKPIPAFASGAKRLVDAAMQQRGLGSSSIAAEALAQGIIEASIPIAQQDAQFYQQAIFQNLNNRQQSAVLNAQQSFQMDTANLSNRQQTSLTNIQLRQQSMLSDQAASNASLQFNAQSEQQTDQFFKSLATQINSNNSQRVDAMNQYAVAEKNRISGQNAQNEIAVSEANAQREAAISQFNTQLEDQRQRFNVENQRLIDQSNVTWRRSINTANTASINAANQTDAQNLLNISNFGLSALWQQWRDEASWVNTSSENLKERAHNIAIAAIQRETQLEYMSEASKYGLSEMLGELGLRIFGNIKLGDK
tara:strand:- start:692 stop:2356 length:1665 start_codon:yes stop_codon:yes gene_type:complete